MTPATARETAHHRTGRAAHVSVPFFDAAYAAPVRLADAGTELPADLTMAALRVQPGPLTVPDELPRRAIALLVLEGVLVRTAHVNRQGRAELLGSGDVICPWDDGQASATLRSRVDWAVLEPARLGVLDPAFSKAAGPALTLRGVQRANRLALQFAIGDMRRIDDRLIALFVHLGDRWGRRTVDGIHVRLRLTHDLIAQLVGAKRPTVTTALSDLQRAGRLRRGADKTWVVSADAVDPATGG